MLEEKNDNLSLQENEIDGKTADGSQETIQSETSVATENEISESIAEQNTENPISETVISNENGTDEKQNVIDAIAETNAEESEDETLKERHDIPMLDYEALSMETLVDELKNLVTNEKVMSIKDHVEEIKKAFLAKYNHLIEEKKEEFNNENQDSN